MMVARGLIQVQRGKATVIIMALTEHTPHISSEDKR
jgi:hypothetical protein